MNRRELGKRYEEYASEQLQKVGFVVIGRNEYTPFGEIVLILCRKGVYFFVEVKFRKGDRFGSPKDAIDRGKRSRMLRSALFFRKENGIAAPFRISLYGIQQTGDQLIEEWIEDIFVQ